MEKDPGVYVRHILEAIANIEADTAGYDFERFRLDRRAGNSLSAISKFSPKPAAAFPRS